MNINVFHDESEHGLLDPESNALLYRSPVVLEAFSHKLEAGLCHHLA